MNCSLGPHKPDQFPPCEECLNSGIIHCCEGLQMRDENKCEHYISYDKECADCNVKIDALFEIIENIYTPKIPPKFQLSNVLKQFEKKK